MSFSSATPVESGVTASHLPSIHGVCKAKNCFLFLRPSTQATMRLIDAGFATKSMDIHEKSSNWGLTAGFVPSDQAFSKKKIGQPNPHIRPPAHGEAQPCHLTFTPSQFSRLLGQGHFEKTREAGPQEARAESAEYRQFHSTENGNVCFLLHKQSGKVFWRARSGGQLVPMWVLGYKGVPVTGDYDMWMAVPHVTKVDSEGAIDSVKDGHGRSAASGFTTSLIGALNAACDRPDKPVFNHGAEAQNVSFTQELDRHLVTFCPGSKAPFMTPRMVLPGVLHDLLRHGYVAVLNPKWKSGTTLGIDDMADAPTSLQDYPIVRAGTEAKQKLKADVGAALFNIWRQNKKDKPPLDAELQNALDQQHASWRKRYDTLRFFRAVARAPEQQQEDLVLPPDAFPGTGAGSMEDTAQMARKLAKAVEEAFGRKGFVEEGGSVVPVDQTAPLPEPGAVRRLISKWEEISQNG